MTETRTAGLGRYLAEAFLFRWNLLLFLGGTAAGALSPVPDVLIPLVGAAELAYLAALTSIPRFRAAIDAKVYGEAKGPLKVEVVPAQTLGSLLAGLTPDARNRFQALHARCREMRGIAAGVRGAAGDQATGDAMSTPGLDRLLWLFLRLLVSKAALDRFLRTTNEQEMSSKAEELRKSLDAAQKGSDERVTKSLQDSLAMAELRLDNFSRAKKNAEFVSIELDRIEGKIQALAEMAVNRQDPDFLSGQADAAAESMRQTEKAVSELQHLTGLGEQLEEPPPILESDLRQVLKS
ncbi:MAG TPA: hypothetical protein VGI12_12950 [Vicinamibacterales bacterium]|jgi:hypothetical protein